MAMQFPASPAVGQTFSPTAGVVYRWSGLAWYLITPGALSSALLGQPNGVASLDAGGDVPASQLGNAVLATEKGAANGVATLNGAGKVPAAQIPSPVYVSSGNIIGSRSFGTEYINTTPNPMHVSLTGTSGAATTLTAALVPPAGGAVAFWVWGGPAGGTSNSDMGIFVTVPPGWRYTMSYRNSGPTTVSGWYELSAP